MRRVVLACLLGLLLVSEVRPCRAEPTAEGIWAYWPLAGDARDHSPNRRDGTRHGRVADAAMPGPFSGATQFSGGWIEVPSASASSGGSFTVAAWVFFDTGSRAFVPVVGRMGVNGSRMQLSYDLGDESAASVIASEIGLTWRRWSHVAVMWDEPGRVLSFWQRGIRVLAVDVAPDTLVPPPFGGPFGLAGPARDGRVFTGRLADAVVYHRVLGLEELQFLASGAGRQTPQQVAMSSGCGGAEQGPCLLCRRYRSWPPAQWADCADGYRPWCAGNPEAGRETCP